MNIQLLPLKAGFRESFQLAAVARHIQHTESVSNEPGIAYRVTVKFRRQAKGGAGQRATRDLHGIV